MALLAQCKHCGCLLTHSCTAFYPDAQGVFVLCIVQFGLQIFPKTMETQQQINSAVQADHCFMRSIKWP